MKNLGLKIDWFLVSILDHFFSLLDSKMAPNRLQNPPKIDPGTSLGHPGTPKWPPRSPPGPNLRPIGLQNDPLGAHLASQEDILDQLRAPRDQKSIPKPPQELKNYSKTTLELKLYMPYLILYTPHFHTGHFPLLRSQNDPQN